ncbi:MAG: hypothetical protein COA86_12800 [Kangiella sp.]|nr:MAG: hypothetical protein COA86_12800 [Kangiella sp.]
MKVASRFPIKESKGLLTIVILLHLAVSVLSFFIFNISWQYGFVLVSLLISYYFSIKQLQQITQAPDDLCWTGNQWLISVLNDKNKLVSRDSVYLSILPSSWITRGFSLIKFRVVSFNDENTQFAWFFSASNLGDRQYRELCYLCKQSLKEQSKENVVKSS